MTPGKIWKLMLQKKVFQIWEIAEELQKLYPFLPKKWIRDKVREFVKTQIDNGAIVQVFQEPPIFAVSKYANEWKKYVQKRTCETCGKKFIPFRPEQVHCSVKCRERKKATPLPPQKTQKKWTKEEEELLKKLLKEKEKLKKGDLTEIAQRLGRSYRSVWHKVRRLRFEAQNNS